MGQINIAALIGSFSGARANPPMNSPMSQNGMENTVRIIKNLNEFFKP